MTTRSGAADEEGGEAVASRAEEAGHGVSAAAAERIAARSVADVGAARVRGARSGARRASGGGSGTSAPPISSQRPERHGPAATQRGARARADDEGAPISRPPLAMVSPTDVSPVMSDRRQAETSYSTAAAPQTRKAYTSDSAATEQVHRARGDAGARLGARRRRAALGARADPRARARGARTRPASRAACFEFGQRHREGTGRSHDHSTLTIRARAPRSAPRNLRSGDARPRRRSLRRRTRGRQGATTSGISGLFRGSSTCEERRGTTHQRLRRRATEC